MKLNNGYCGLIKNLREEIRLIIKGKRVVRPPDLLSVRGAISHGVML